MSKSDQQDFTKPARDLKKKNEPPPCPMTEPEAIRPLVLTLAKLLVFAAWADGEIQEEEYEVIKDQLFMLPDLTEEDWASVLIYMEYPMTEAELANVVKDFNEILQTEDQRDYAMRAVACVVGADDIVTKSEQRAFDSLCDSIREQSLLGKLVKGFRKVLELARSRRRKSASETFNREKNLYDFLHNPVFFRLVREAKAFKEPLQFSKYQLRKLSLAGAIMARVAHADELIHEDEVAVMFECLADSFFMTDNGALLVLSIALNKQYRDLDMLRICRLYYEVTSVEERLDFFRTLVEIAEADGDVDASELEVLEEIAGHLKIHTSKVYEMLGIPEGPGQSVA